MSSVAHKTVNANGQGPIVLLVHGFPESWHSWRHQLAPIADAGFRAVAVDMRGYGRSSKPEAVHDYRHNGAGRRLCGRRPGARHIDCGDHRPGVLHPGGRPRERDGGRPYGFFRDLYYSFSGDPYPPEYEPLDVLTVTPREVLEFTRAGGACLDPGAKMRDGRIAPEPLPDWLADDLDFTSRSSSALACGPRSTGTAASHSTGSSSRPTRASRSRSRPCSSDPTLTWRLCGAPASIARFEETVPQLTETVIMQNCGTG
jgi:hypothetical protein